MMQRKIEWLSDIGDKPDTYGNVYVNLKFDDGTVAYKAGKPEDMAKHYNELFGLKVAGELVEFELEDTGKKTAKGEPKMKLVGYPGWEAKSADGGGKKGWVESYRNTAEGFALEQDSIHRSVALKLAVKMHGEVFVETKAFEDEVTYLFNFYLKLLRASESAGSTATAGNTSESNSRNGGGGTSTDPIPPERPVKDSQGVGEGPAVTPVDGPRGEAVSETASPSDTIVEPHPFVEGRQLASGKWLCKVCGKKDNEHG